MLGDSYGAAVVAALSRKELQAMDEEQEDTGDEEVLIGGRPSGPSAVHNETETD